MVNARQCCTHWRISLCVVHFIFFHELHSFLLSCFFFFLGYLRQHVLSVYTRVRVDVRKKNWSPPVVVSGYSIEVIALQSITSWIGSVVPIFTRVFERKTSIKMAVFFSLVPFPFAHLCWDIPGAPWLGRMCGFPFQTGLSCPSHHQGSLLKYIPSVKARG